MDVAFCIEAVEEALTRFGKPDIFNTDQGSQFTSREFRQTPDQSYFNALLPIPAAA